MLDFIIIVFIGLTGFIASRKGFIKAAYQMFSFVLALIVSIVTYPIISYILKLTPLYEKIKFWSINSLSSMEIIGGLQAQNSTIREATRWLPDFIVEQIVQNNNPEVYVLMKVNNLVEYIGTYIADLCVNAIALVSIWILARITLGLIMRTLDLFTKVSLLNFTNKVAGFALGVVKGIFIIWIVDLVIPILVIMPEYEKIKILLENSILGEWLYNNNLILNYLNQIFF